MSRSIRIWVNKRRATNSIRMVPRTLSCVVCNVCSPLWRYRQIDRLIGGILMVRILQYRAQMSGSLLNQTRTRDRAYKVSDTVARVGG